MISQNLAPIWLPHWPAWMWTISLILDLGSLEITKFDWNERSTSSSEIYRKNEFDAAWRKTQQVGHVATFSFKEKVQCDQMFKIV